MVRFSPARLCAPQARAAVLGALAAVTLAAPGHGQDLRRQGARWGAPTELYEGGSSAEAPPIRLASAVAPRASGATASGGALGRLRPQPVIVEDGGSFVASAFTPPAVSAAAGVRAVAPSSGGRMASPRGSRAHRKIGRPYQVNGVWYVPARDDRYDETGVASWYGPGFHGGETANGEVFDAALMTAAHPTLPLPSFVRVTNLETGREITVRVNDRGPFADDRIIDLSRAAAEALGFADQGTARVRVRWVSDAPLPHEGDAYPDAPPTMVAAAPARPAPSRPERRRGSDGGFYVQAGSFSERGRADAVARELGRDAHVIAARVHGRRVHRVVTGPWQSRDDADAARRVVARAGFADAILVNAD